MANTKITNPELFNLGDSTSATQLPVMTTTERIAMNAAPTLVVDYLVVAGGGGGARSAFTTGGAYGGGGGAGEYLYKTAQTLTVGGSGYTVTVGDGGNAGISGVSATNGGNSVFIDTTLGGGYGGTSNNSTYSPGGSGGSGGGSGINGSTVYAGGSSTATSPGLGNAGGASTSTVSTSGAGGGGGAGTAGSNGTSSTGGNGGTGVQNSITSTATFYAGGGGGGSYNNNNVGSGGSGVGGNANARAAGSPGVSNTGSGGGGGSYSGSAHTNGATGGSGIVILRYPTADIASYTATGLTPTETTDGTDTILSFTTVGTGTITFTSSTPTGTISTGEMIFNSTTDKVEYFDGTKWYGIAYVESPYSAVIWEGTGTTNPRTGVGFQPDLIWVKNRELADSSGIVDSVRGISSPAPYLSSNLTSAQNTSTNMPTSVQLDGFTITGNGGRTNSINEDYVAWCFKAGGTAVPNTNGSRPSQVSANVDGGFSIVSWSGNSTNPSTVGHGLGVAPELFIIKNLSSAVNWSVYNSSVGAGNKLQLNSSNQASATSNYANTSPTSSVFSLSGGNEVNGSGSSYIAYCFHSVAGLSKVGSYVGNGLTNGPTVALGFEPSFLMCKETTNTGNWRIMDNTRQPSNPKSNGLWANLSNAESASGTNVVNFNSDNFQVVGGGSDVNTSGQTYMYLAFA